MKRMIVALALGALAGCSTSHAPGVDRAVRPGTPGAVVDAWHDAAARGDWDTYVALMTDDIVFLGTDKTERWVGKSFRDFARPYFTGPTAYGQGAWTYASVERHVETRGAIAWWDERLTHERYGNCRGTGVLIREGARWRVAHYSLTFPVPNEIAAEVVEQIQTHEEETARSGG